VTSAPRILGVSGLYHDSAAALVQGCDILAAAQEERFTRHKHDPRFPENAIRWCIGEAGGPDAIEAVAFYEDPALAFDRILRNAVEMAPATEGIWPQIAALQLGQKLGVVERLTREVGPVAAENVFLVDHHLSHAASAFFPSPFDEAAILVVDGMGEWASTTIAHGQDTAIDTLEQVHYPHSLGLFYAAFTHHCGLKVNSGEYKLMGLAPYGEPRFAARIMERMIDLRDDGSFRLNLEYFGFLATGEATTPEFGTLFGCDRRDPQARIERVHMDLAASAQAVLEEALLRLARRALARAQSRHLCLAGGVALNCVANGRLLRELPGLAGIWVQPAAGDAGGALGAALQVAHTVYGAPRHSGVGRRDGQRGSLLGPGFDDAAIRAALTAEGLSFETPADRAAHRARVADALAAGLIVGRFHGAMEFGPRALGNRSILADARLASGQAHINLAIKFRESWRPFAPMVLAERAAEFFELDVPSPYMLLVAPVQAALRLPDAAPGFDGEDDDDMLRRLRAPRSTLPAVTHVDGSARVQTVDAETDPDLHALLAAFAARTGCPVLVNTSFNVRGEPIVCTPDDAVQCFLNTGIDLLAIGDHLVFKAAQPAALRERVGGLRFAPD